MERRERSELVVRCPNCFLRVTVPPRAERVTCPKCVIEYRIAWVAPDQPLIRGPVKWPR